MTPEDDTAQGKLVAFRNDRLGARLLTLVNAMRMSADHGVPWACHWPLATDVTAVFNDATELFDADFVDRHFISREAWTAARKQALRIGDATRRDAAHMKEEAAKGRAVAVDQAFGINAFTDEDPARVHTRFIETLAQVPFSAPLRPLIETLDRTLTGSTAYHIRRGDLTEGLAAKNKPWPHKMVPNEFYELHMEQALGDGGSAILFSDDVWTLEHYTKTFPALRTIRDVISMDGLTEAQRDFIELYAMSRAALIIAPERSAFSSTAVHMGTAAKRDVTEDLTPEMQKTAYERLIDRLRNRPESFPNDGEIGQSLAHVGPYLTGEGRGAEATELFAGQVDRGLNIAFIYPETMRLQHKAGDVEGVLRTASLMHGREIFHLRYFVEGEFLHGYGQIRAGDWDRGRRHIANAFWHGATSTDTRILIPALVEIGVLPAEKFIPVSEMQLNMHRRQGPVKNFIANYTEILRLANVREMRPLGMIDTAVWDWALLLRGVSLVAAARSGAVAEARARLAQMDPAADPAEHASLDAFLQACEGDAMGAAARLVDLAEAEADHAMTWQRLSHTLAMARRFDEAADAAEQAAGCAPGLPAMAAWAGLMLLRVRRYPAAVEHLTRANAADLGFASIPAALAEALVGKGAHEEALTAIEQAIALAPMEAEFAMQRAEILEDIGDRTAAIAALTAMVDRHRAPGKLFRRLVELMRAHGDTDGARRMVALCQERYPEHPATLRLLEEMAA